VSQRAIEVRAELNRLCAPVEQQAKFDERGGSLWFSREQWGVIIDALIAEREAALRRKADAPDGMTDLRADIAERTLWTIDLAGRANHDNR
jgi:hypothetical protein